MVLYNYSKKGLKPVTRLQLEENEEISRKEYFKRKKKQERILKKRSKITYIVIITAILLVVYITIQMYVYNEKNNYSYLADENVDKQSVYNVYYITEGYTYNPVYSLNSIYSNGINDNTLISNVGFSDISVTKDYIVGIKENKLYTYDKKNNELKQLFEKNVEKFTIYDNVIYAILQESQVVCSYNLITNEYLELNIKQAIEILIDDNNIFVVKDEKIKKRLYSYDKSGGNEKLLDKNSNVSYVIQNGNCLYFVNKDDENKIYVINKDGSECTKVDDISSVTDSGVVKNIDGSKYMYVYNNNLYYVNSNDNYSLWKYNLETKENVKEISMQVELLQNVNETVFYKVKNSVGVYLYNADTKFMSEITKRKVKEFIVDTYTEVFIDEKKLK